MTSSIISGTLPISARYLAHPCWMLIICPLLHCQCVVCSYFLIVLILTNDILYCMQECTGFRDAKHNFRYHCMLAVYLLLTSFCDVICSYHLLCSFFSVMFCFACRNTADGVLSSIISCIVSIRARCRLVQ